MREFVINQNDAGQRVDKFVTKAVPLLPQALLYKSIRTKRIKLNGKRCEISTRLCEGDRLSLYLNDEFFGGAPGAPAFLSVPPTVDVLYEDENILLADKRPGLLVHEDEGGQTDTLINRILHYLYQKGEYDPARENSFTPALCNRIDRNTGGIVIAIGTSSPEEGFDCDQNTFKITGGTLIGIGGSTSTPTSNVCTQPSLIYGGSGTQNTLFHISAADGTDILTFNIPRTLQQMTLLFSSPALKSGSGYTIHTGGTVAGGTDFYGLYSGATYSGGTQAATFTTSSMVTTIGSYSGRPGGGGGGGRPGGW